LACVLTSSDTSSLSSYDIAHHKGENKKLILPLEKMIKFIGDSNNRLVSEKDSHLWIRRRHPHRPEASRQVLDLVKNHDG
jgi:hypothetical protein